MDKLKIIHIIPSIKIGGAEILVIDICVEISKRKNYEVKLITFSNEYGLNEISQSFHYHIPSYYHPSISAKSEINTCELQDFINDFNPDIIHSHLWESEILLTQLKIKKAVRFSHFHDNMYQLRRTLFPTGKKDLTDLFEKNKILKSKLSNFICISKDTLLYAKKVLPKKLTQNIHLLSNAIDYKKFQNNNIKKPTKLRLINVGSFVAKKNQTFLIDILLELKKRDIQCELFLLGEGEELQKVKDKAFVNGLKNEIHFLGNVNNVEEELWKSHLYIHSAYYEPFGLVLLEAMAAGLPVVSLDGKGNRDFIKNGINGYILENEDPKLFSDIIMNLVQNKELYGEIAEKGKVTAQKYDIKNYTTKLINIYKDSMSSKN